MSLTHYEVLKLNKSASEDEIKKAYRKLARECHPDKFPGDSEKEEQFKKINEAYEVLSDSDKKSYYDNPPPSPNVFFTQPGSFQDMFNMMSRSIPKKGTDIIKDVNVKFSRMYSNRFKNFKIRSGNVNGGTVDIKLDLLRKNKQYIIPNLGNKEKWAMFPGSLIININVINDFPEFKQQVETPDIFYSKDIDMGDFLNGISFDLEMPDGTVKHINHTFLNEPLSPKPILNAGMSLNEEGTVRGALYITYTVINVNDGKNKMLE